jgi:hypothetical protein
VCLPQHRCSTEPRYGGAAQVEFNVVKLTRVMVDVAIVVANAISAFGVTGILGQDHDGVNFDVVWTREPMGIYEQILWHFHAMMPSASGRLSFLEP